MNECHESPGSANNVKTIPFFFIETHKNVLNRVSNRFGLIKIDNYLNICTLNRRKSSTQLLLFRFFPFVRLPLCPFTEETLSLSTNTLTFLFVFKLYSSIFFVYRRSNSFQHHGSKKMINLKQLHSDVCY